ncbi:IPT/TIG domain-containing protein [Sorangium sp. So ce327]|uniref:IPT/TIG domain-containing protein n=1 Tax=Sorangium sp. So ce327 TaxID=3133301 RepID=UPI003F616FBA
MDIPPEMIAALESHRYEILNINGVLGIDIGFTEPGGVPTDDIAIRVLVPDLNNVPAGIPDELEGFPVVVIQRNVEFDQDLARYDPVQGGISVGRSAGILGFSGTLGGIVLDATTKELRGLSCRHVLCHDPFAVGDVIQQPEPTSSVVNHLGTLLRWSQWTPGGPPWPPGTQLAYSDAAICTIDRVVGWPTIVDIGPAIRTATPRLKDRVRKRGRTTMLTHGIVNAVMRTHLNQEGVMLLDDFEVRVDSALSTVWSDHGDSGSLVVNDTGDVVGLNWGRDRSTGMGCVNYIGSLATDLGISLDWPIPQIWLMTPAEGSSSGGETVVISGVGFQLASEVRFGGVLVPMFLRQGNSDNVIVATTPPGTGTVEVTVTAPGGTSLGSTFTYV